VLRCVLSRRGRADCCRVQSRFVDGSDDFEADGCFSGRLQPACGLLAPGGGRQERARTPGRITCSALCACLLCSKNMNIIIDWIDLIRIQSRIHERPPRQLRLPSETRYRQPRPAREIQLGKSISAPRSHADDHGRSRALEQCPLGRCQGTRALTHCSLAAARTMGSTASRAPRTEGAGRNKLQVRSDR
jgi:hypothetical protein